jgi:hypothetical protein
MSYMQFQQQCEDCGESWNAAFGIVGTTYIAQPPTECPYCNSPKIKKIADYWAPITPTESSDEKAKPDTGEKDPLSQ